MGEDKKVGGSRECEKCRNNYPAEFANCPECGHPQEAFVVGNKSDECETCGGDGVIRTYMKGERSVSCPDCSEDTDSEENGELKEAIEHSLHLN